MKIAYTFFLFLIFASGLYGQQANVVQTPVMYSVVQAAEIIEKDGETIVLLEGNIKQKYGVKLVIDGAPNKFIEVHDEKKPFPPKVLTPYKENTYLVEGEVGQKFYVSIRSDGFPIWLEVVIQKTGPPTDPNPNPNPTPVDPNPTPVPGDFADLDKLLKDKLPADKVTQKVIIDSYKQSISQIKADTNYTLEKAKEIVSKNRGAALLTLPRLNTNWNDFLFALKAELDKAPNKETYLKMLEYLVSKADMQELTSLQDDLIKSFKDKAKEENKFIMLIFTGSDWCHYCKLLDKEILESEAFKEFEKNFVKYIADFPTSDVGLSPEAIRFNANLLAKYKGLVESYPTVLILDKNGKVLLKSGYIKGGPQSWIATLNKYLEGFKNGD